MLAFIGEPRAFFGSCQVVQAQRLDIEWYLRGSITETFYLGASLEEYTAMSLVHLEVDPREG